MNRIVFTKEQIEAMRHMRKAFDASWAAIGRRFGASHNVVRAAVEPDFAAKVKQKQSQRNRKEEEARRKSMDMRGMRSDGTNVPQFVVDRRDKYLSAPYRSLADQMLGCPPVGFSALDRKQARASA